MKPCLSFLVIASLAAGETPFACNLAALSPQARTRHFEELTPALGSQVRTIRELSDGFEFHFSPLPSLLPLISEWLVGERACCPFLDLDLRLEREGGPIQLRLTGRPGVKQFLRAEFERWFKRN